MRLVKCYHDVSLATDEEKTIEFPTTVSAFTVMNLGEKAIYVNPNDGEKATEAGDNSVLILPSMGRDFTIRTNAISLFATGNTLVYIDCQAR